jgi:hypothetical protein
MIKSSALILLLIGLSTLVSCFLTDVEFCGANRDRGALILSDEIQSFFPYNRSDFQKLIFVDSSGSTFLFNQKELIDTGRHPVCNKILCKRKGFTGPYQCENLYVVPTYVSYEFVIPSSKTPSIHFLEFSLNTDSQFLIGEIGEDALIFEYISISYSGGQYFQQVGWWILDTKDGIQLKDSIFVNPAPITFHSELSRFKMTYRDVYEFGDYRNPYDSLHIFFNKEFGVIGWENIYFEDSGFFLKEIQ